MQFTSFILKFRFLVIKLRSMKKQENELAVLFLIHKGDI
jgi:hypothetical protein